MTDGKLRSTIKIGSEVEIVLKEYFVHVSGLIDEIREGDVVEFELEEGRKGLNAVNVKVV